MDVERQYRDEIVRFGCLLHLKDYVAATGGNLTVRLGADRVLATPTGMSKGMIDCDDLVIVDLQGRRISGQRPVTSEIGMHLLIYHLRPDVKGIVHAHPVTATGYAAAGVGLDTALLSEAVLSLGRIPLAPYATPGTEELAAVLKPLILNHDAILMANHGVVTYGPSLMRAYLLMETVEHFARIALTTHLLGKQQPLNDVQMQKLVTLRECYLAADLPQTPSTQSPQANPGAVEGLKDRA